MKPHEIGATEDLATDRTPVVGAVESFDRFYAREFPKLVDVAHAMSGSRMAAEDLAQEAMIVAFRRQSLCGRRFAECAPGASFPVGRPDRESAARLPIVSAGRSTHGRTDDQTHHLQVYAADGSRLFTHIRPEER